MDTSGLEGVLEAARAKTESTFVARRFFVPTVLFRADRPRRFTVGPVEFVQSELFFEEYARKLESLERRKSSETEEVSPIQTSSLRSYYEKAGWVGVISISPACPKASRAKAEFLAVAALNVIRLMCGRSATYRTQTADERGRNSRWSKIWEEGEKGFRHSFSLGDNGHNVGDDWDQLFARHKSTFDAAVTAISAFTDFSDAPPLCRRFVDALSWYGEAATDNLPAPRIVKLVTALEVMVGTGRELDEKGRTVRGVTKIVCTRAALWHSFATRRTFGESYQLLETLYALRSDIVHGSASLNDESLISKSHDAEELVRMILLTGLNFFEMLGLLARQFATDRLGEVFRKWEMNPHPTPA